MTERTFPPFLYIETSPGCETEADAKLKIKAALVALLFWCLPNVPCATRWLTCTGTLGWYLLGCLVNKLFVRGYRACFEKSEGALNLKNLGNWNDATRATGDVDMEASNDEWHVRLGKRLRRGARFFSDRLCAATMTFEQMRRSNHKTPACGHIRKRRVAFDAVRRPRSTSGPKLPTVPSMANFYFQHWTRSQLK